jgi:hypothetical protein
MLMPQSLSQLVPPAICFVLTCLNPNPVTTFELANGVVRLENPIQFQDLSLSNPRLLGSGGGGAAFSLKSSRQETMIGQTNNRDDVLVKVSWGRSTESVRNECQILQVLKRNNVDGVETCLGNMVYPDDPSRVMIFMEPVIDDPVSGILDISPELRPNCVASLVRTMVQMLASNVVTTDVQPLIFQRTGQLFLIDMTEAQFIKEPFSFLDLAKVSSFCTEVSNYIPEALLGVASKSAASEMESLESRGVHLPDEVAEILKAQFYD